MKITLHSIPQKGSKNKHAGSFDVKFVQIAKYNENHY